MPTAVKAHTIETLLVRNTSESVNIIENAYVNVINMLLP